MKLSTIKRRFNKEFRWVTYPNPLIKAAPRIWDFILEYFEPKSNQVEAQVKPVNGVIKIIDELRVGFGKPIIIGGDDVENEITKSIAETYLDDFIEQLKSRLSV